MMSQRFEERSITLARAERCSHECPLLHKPSRWFSVGAKGVAEWGSRTKGWWGGVWPKAKKKLWPHHFWWRKWLLMCPKELRMVFLEFKMSLSHCSYCIGCWKERESRLNSLNVYGSRITNSCLGTGHALAANLTPQSTVDSIVSVVISSM